jgi:opacity protein-like surface antigen
MKMRRLVYLILLASLALISAFGVSYAAQPAEEPRPFYVGVFGGYSFPEKLSLEGRGTLDGVSFSDAALQNGWNGGVKLGWVMPAYERWFNWEFEYWYQNLSLKQQNLTASAGGFSMPVPISGTRMDVHTFSSNFILRRPTGMIQPYAGVGPSVVYVDLKNPPNLANGSQSTAGFGVNFLVGTRVMFTQNLGIFAEFKHNRAIDLKLDDIKFNLNSNAVVGGLVWNFDAFTLP